MLQQQKFKGLLGTTENAIALWIYNSRNLADGLNILTVLNGIPLSTREKYRRLFRLLYLQALIYNSRNLVDCLDSKTNNIHYHLPQQKFNVSLTLAGAYDLQQQKFNVFFGSRYMSLVRHYLDYQKFNGLFRLSQSQISLLPSTTVEIQ